MREQQPIEQSHAGGFYFLLVYVALVALACGVGLGYTMAR